MQRVRMSLPYYRELGWDVELICVDARYTEGFKDELLTDTIPADIPLHRVGAWPAKFTRKFGLGSLSMRSYFHFKKKGTALLQKKKFDLVFFSTSMFHVCALGRYWKKKFGIPFIIDMQDPWRNDFYLNKPFAQRPPKFRLAYTINKKMEAYTMPHVAGIMAVSPIYIEDLKNRYPVIQNCPAIVIPFGCSSRDFEYVKNKKIAAPILDKKADKIKVVYVGAITPFFMPLIRAFFKAFMKSNLTTDRYHFYFIGTNYAAGVIEKPIEVLAKELNMLGLVTESPDRIPYFEALSVLMHSDILFIPGSLDAGYNASKVYNNILSGKPIFSIFNNQSLVKKIIEETEAGIVVGVNETDTLEEVELKITLQMKAFNTLHTKKPTANKNLQDYTSEAMTRKQVALFNTVIN